MNKFFYVYLITSTRNNKIVSYVGYTKNVKKRLNLHNSGKGAKFTRGCFWKIIFKKKFESKSSAMKYEYFLKKNYVLRKKIKETHI
jgi:putative endonuclease